MSQKTLSPDIKQVPRESAVREAIRRASVEYARRLSPTQPPTRDDLEQCGRDLQSALSLSETLLGFAMVAISNAFWRDVFASVPFARRLLLLPKCLSDASACAAPIDAIGLHCQGCGACEIHALKTRAESLGCQVIVAEGTTSVLMQILEGRADALLGVACLDSLEKSFTRISGLGIPHVAVPLLTDGCIDTEAEIDEILAYLSAHTEQADAQPHSCMPLLRETIRGFNEPLLTELLTPYVDTGDGLLGATDAIALDWLKDGGKRLRPFVTIAAYAVARYGEDVLSPHAALDGLIPPAIRRLALAIEAMHKASLVHDDIEDDDAFRYGRQTLHRAYGIPPAVNIGDYLVGLGYRLIAGEAERLGSACVADVLAHLAAAHLALCRGQGAELLWQRNAGDPRPRDVLAIYALKTAPAFEVALYTGLRAADCPIDLALLKQIAIYLGEGYQLLNDLEDWQSDDANKRFLGQDVLAARPTLPRAFALEAGAGNELASLATARQADPLALVDAVRALYNEYGIFTKAERMLETLHHRALECARRLTPPALQELMTYFIRIILQQRPQYRAPGMK